jgi:hypothetical protein
MPDPAKLPGFFATVLRSLADIPRQQPINDNLAAIEALSADVRRLRYVIDGMTSVVDAAIDRAIGMGVLLLRPTPVRLAEWRSKLQSVAARESGFAYAAYGQLKIARIVEALSERLAAVGGVPLADVRGALWGYVRAMGLDQPAQALAKGGAASLYVSFLRSFDLEFRTRRLRFLIRRVNALSEATTDDAERHGLEAMKAGLYAIVSPHLERRQPEFYNSRVREAAAGVVTAPEAALAALGDALDLRSLDTISDATLINLFTQLPTRTLKRSLMAAYLGFPFFDIAMLPLLNGDGVDEFDEIKVDRLSPDDALSLRGAGGGTLKGAQFNAFGAFFSRAYREHDYLWGRLHSAERLIDIVASTLPADQALAQAQLTTLKREAFAAIIEAERPRLTQIGDLFAALDRALAEL